MSESVNPTPNNATEQPVAPVSIMAQYIKDLSFENPHILKTLSDPKGTAPQISINVQVQANGIGEKTFEVSLVIEAKATNNDAPAFLIELTYAGVFTLNGVPEDILKAYLLIECPRLLFPFARNIIADVTRDGGMQPLLLNPIDFAELYYQQNPEGADKKKMN